MKFQHLHRVNERDIHSAALQNHKNVSKSVERYFFLLGSRCNTSTFRLPVLIQCPIHARFSCDTRVTIAEYSILLPIRMSIALPSVKDSEE